MNQKPLPVVFLMGPTASGKTALALQLAARLPVEIVSVDSAQVYRGMDIGTAKPSPAMQQQVPHHLLDLLDPAEIYSAARFCTDARAAIAAIRARGRLPLLVGGTMLYFKALRDGLSELPTANAGLRARLTSEAQQHGWPVLHERLKQRDPQSAARLNPNDGQRIQRALELNELTGRTVADLHDEGRRHAYNEPVLTLALSPPQRAELHERIRQRFLQMMADGFLDEVRRLKARADLQADLPSIRAVGYRQLWAHLDGESSYDEAVEQGIAATRQYAKRQITWLRSMADLHLLDPAEPNLCDRVLRLLAA